VKGNGNQAPEQAAPIGREQSSLPLGRIGPDGRRRATAREQRPAKHIPFLVLFWLWHTNGPECPEEAGSPNRAPVELRTGHLGPVMPYE